jgi:hypothetical protein
VTEVDAGDSFHNWGLAVDLIFTRFGYDNGYYKGKEYKGANYGNIYIDTGLVRYAKSLGLRWGGDNTGLVDSAHFEFGILPPPNMRQESLARPKWWENKTIFDDGADWEYMNGKRSAASVSALLDSPASSSGSFLSGVKGVFIAAGVAVVGYMVYKTFIKKG